MVAGLLAGITAATVTNGLEAITVAKQTNPKAKIKKILKEGGFSLMTKGLIPRVCYNGCQSLLFFNLILLIGKIYNVELNED